MLAYKKSKIEDMLKINPNLVILKTKLSDFTDEEI